MQFIRLLCEKMTKNKLLPDEFIPNGKLSFLMMAWGYILLSVLPFGIKAVFLGWQIVLMFSENWEDYYEAKYRLSLFFHLQWFIWTRSNLTPSINATNAHLALKYFVMRKYCQRKHYHYLHIHFSAWNHISVIHTKGHFNASDDCFRMRAQIITMSALIIHSVW